MFYLALGGWALLVISIVSGFISALKKKWIWFVISLIAVIGIVIMGFSDFRLFWIG